MRHACGWCGVDVRHRGLLTPVSVFAGRAESGPECAFASVCRACLALFRERLGLAFDPERYRARFDGAAMMGMRAGDD